MKYLIVKILLSVVVVLICGLFSAMAGSDKFRKAWRRYGVPFLNLALVLVFHFNWWFFSLLFLILPYSKGHGLPSPNDDVPSGLGVFFYKLTKNLRATEILLRLSKGLMKATACICFPLVFGNWAVYIVCSIILILSNVIFGGNAIIKGEGTFQLFKTEMLWEEYIIAGIDSAMVLCIAFIH